MSDANKKIQIGIVGKSHGLHGSFFVSGRENREIPKSYKEVFIGRSEKDAKAYQIIQRKLQGGRPLIKVEEISGRDQAQLLVGQSIFVEKKDVKFDASSEYLHDDLVGKSVVDPSSNVLGQVTSVENYGASDSLSITHAEKGRIEVPFVPSYFDMSTEGEELVLVVDKEIFEDLWETK